MSQGLPLNRKRLWIVGTLSILTIILLTLVTSTIDGSKQLRGSSYNRAPDGYGAWYAYMGDRGTPLTRWQKPFEALTNEQGVTLIRVSSNVSRPIFTTSQEQWLRQGNRLILVGFPGQVTDATFRSDVSSDVGLIRLETRRRYLQNLANSSQALLKDAHGMIAWSSKIAAGEVISIIPSDIAANAFQDIPGNYEFLAQLVSGESNAQLGDRLLIDEYIHGFIDTEVIIEEVAENWVNYMAQTPLILLLIQGILVLLILIWAGNQRSRSPISLEPPEVSNSKAYIEALAGVLQNADTRSFVVNVVGYEEQVRIQQRMGLGSNLLVSNDLLQLWQQQTGTPAAELNQVLYPYWEQKTLSEAEFIKWIQSIQQVHTILDNTL